MENRKLREIGGETIVMEMIQNIAGSNKIILCDLIVDMGDGVSPVTHKNIVPCNSVTNNKYIYFISD